MQRVATETNTFSPADFVGLTSALVLLAAFVIAPWFVSDGSSFTGAALLAASESHVPIQKPMPIYLPT